jgi:hypothetical protein
MRTLPPTLASPPGSLLTSRGRRAPLTSGPTMAAVTPLESSHAMDRTGPSMACSRLRRTLTPPASRQGCGSGVGRTRDSSDPRRSAAAPESAGCAPPAGPRGEVGACPQGRSPWPAGSSRGSRRQLYRLALGCMTRPALRWWRSEALRGHAPWFTPHPEMPPRDPGTGEIRGELGTKPSESPRSNRSGTLGRPAVAGRAGATLRPHLRRLRA